jgi:serine protease Do
MEEQKPVTSQPKVAPTQSKVTTSKRHSSRNGAITMLVVIFVSISAGFAGGFIGANSNLGNKNNNVSVEQGRQAVEEQSNLISSLAKDVGPSVVSIDVTSQGTVQNGFFGSRTVEQQSAGTGFIISDNGYVLTNRHVLPEGASKVSLTMSDGTVLDDVSVVGTTSNSDSLDVGFLKINNTKGKKLTVAKLGDSSKAQVGDTVIAIGNALGQFQNTVTSGIVSGYGRSVQASDGSGTNSENLQNLFQTDAAINQGNSGGPLVNANGEVIGINTAVAGDGAQNIGFAIPINDAKGLVKGVLESGKLQRPYLGVRYIQLTPASASEMGVKTENGAYINGSNGTSGVVAGGPADSGGLKDGDVIIKINDQPVDQNNTLSSVIGRFSVGETVTVTYIRDGQQQTTQLKLGELPN